MDTQFTNTTTREGNKRRHQAEFTARHGGGALGGESTSSVCCSLQAYGRPPVVSRRRLAFAGPAGSPPCNGVRALHLQSNGLPREGLHEDLHATAETEDEVESRLFLDVVVRKRTAVLELLACEDEPLLVRRDPLLVLDLSFHVELFGHLTSSALLILDANSLSSLILILLSRCRWCRSFDLEGDGFSSERLNKDLHLYQRRQGIGIKY